MFRKSHRQRENFSSTTDQGKFDKMIAPGRLRKPEFVLEFRQIFRVLFWAIVSAGLILNFRASAQNDLFAGLFEGDDVMEAMNEASSALGDQNCKDIRCKALSDVFDIFYAFHLRDRQNNHPQTRIVQLLSDDGIELFEIADAAVHRIMLTHPERGPLYCAIMRKLVRVQINAGENANSFVGNQILEIAMRVDALMPGCFASVLAALPSTQAGVDTIYSAARDCEALNLIGCKEAIAALGPLPPESVPKGYP
jgi:hypothetical protein